ncbi:MAG TPA: hypothetical protein VHC39_06150 [Rhizomicrobium sp.]|nr:hypothetical protein [Rhizomicrobium sp.]
MFRVFAIAAIAAATISAAQAEDSLTARVHEAAMKACAAKVGDSLPTFYYRALSARCADRVAADALARIRARQVAQADASTAQN